MEEVRRFQGSGYRDLAKLLNSSGPCDFFDMTRDGPRTTRTLVARINNQHTRCVLDRWDVEVSFTLKVIDCRRYWIRQTFSGTAHVSAL